LSFKSITAGFGAEGHSGTALSIEEWLDPEVHKSYAINAMFKPGLADWLECVEVSTLVNSPRNNRAEVLEPFKAAE